MALAGQHLLDLLQMLVKWFKERMREGRPAGRYLVLLYLVRGRLPEALDAHRELLSSLPAGQTGALSLNWFQSNNDVNCAGVQHSAAALQGVAKRRHRSI